MTKIQETGDKVLANVEHVIVGKHHEVRLALVAGPSVDGLACVEGEAEAGGEGRPVWGLPTGDIVVGGTGAGFSSHGGGRTPVTAARA